MPLAGHKNGSKPFLKSLTLTTGVPSCVMSSVRRCSTKTVSNGVDMSVSLNKLTHSNGFTTLFFLLFFTMLAKSRSQGNLLWPERGFKTWISSRFLWIIEQRYARICFCFCSGRNNCQQIPLIFLSLEVGWIYNDLNRSNLIGSFTWIVFCI